MKTLSEEITVEKFKDYVDSLPTNKSDPMVLLKFLKKTVTEYMGRKCTAAWVDSDNIWYSLSYDTTTYIAEKPRWLTDLEEAPFRGYLPCDWLQRLA